MKDFMRNVGGVDLGFVGSKYTWENKQEVQMLIKERLDRAMASKEWVDSFQQASVRHINMEASDHCPILFQMDNHQKHRRRPLRFFKAWTSNKTSCEVIQRAWNLNRMSRVC